GRDAGAPTAGDAGAHADTLACRIGDVIRGAVSRRVPDRLEPDLVGGCVVTRGVTRFIAVGGDLRVATRPDGHIGADTDA
ncbi:MAG TPA: hypothetical protein VF302_07815, partial [Candidatus Limnocylindrales bacterium]